ncbi:MAG: ATP-binding protein [Nitrososphaerota archaeon]|nr:ATP-binding protein [Nitrososphaerota archaeon]
MGWKLNALALLFALWCLDVGALVVGVPILLVLLYKWWSERQSRPAALGPSRGMARAGAFFLVLSVVAVVEGGTFSPLVFGGLGVALLALGAFPRILRDAAEKVGGPASQLFASRPKSPGAVPCVELTKVPLRYLDPRKSDPKETLLRFQRLSQTLAETGAPVEMRLEFSGGSGRILFLVTGKDAAVRLPDLLRVAKSQLPEFGAEAAELHASVEAYSVSVDGIPALAPDPLGPLARFFVENRLDGSYSIRLSPGWVNPASRWLAARGQRKLAEGSGYQQADDDRTTTVVDHPNQVRLEDSVRGLERLLARRPVRVSVQVSAGDPSTAARAADVLAGALSSQRKIDGLRVRRPRASDRSTWHPSALMTPAEAAPYLWVPQVPLGMKVAPSAEFQAPAATQGEVVLGEVVSVSGKTGQAVRMPLDQLAKHLFVTGMTGSGKTTSCLGLLVQLDRLRVPFLVVEPAKSEYRNLMEAVPGLRVFTAGVEGAAPLRLNIFEPPPGVSPQAHLDNLVAVWNGSFVAYSPVQYVIPRVFAAAYNACGWDLASGREGRPVTLEDVKAQAARVVRELGYEPRVTMDIEAAIGVRLHSLTEGTKGPLFGARASTPLGEILSGPTVVELWGLASDEEKAFVASLLLMNVAGFVQASGPSRHLKHLTLVEEAHRLLPRLSTEKGDPESTDPRRILAERFGNMLAELRAFGEGLAVVEQIPTKILPDAIKNTATKMVHRVASYDDRKVMAGAMNATREQSAVLTALMPGEAVVSVEGHPVPFRVEVDDAVARLGIREASDDDVRTRMAGFYLRNPPGEGERGAEEAMRELVDSAGFRKPFLEMYRIWARTGKGELLGSFLMLSASRFSRDREGQVEAATKMLSLATARYLPFDAERRAKFPRLFRRELEAVARG